MSNFSVSLPGWQKILSALVTFPLLFFLRTRFFSSSVGCQSMLGGAAPPGDWSTSRRENAYTCTSSYHRLNTARLRANQPHLIRDTDSKHSLYFILQV